MHWFNLECPKRASEFDDPIKFNRKFRDFLAYNKSIAEAVRQKIAAYNRIEKLYGYYSAHPEYAKSY